MSHTHKDTSTCMVCLIGAKKKNAVRSKPLFVLSHYFCILVVIKTWWISKYSVLRVFVDLMFPSICGFCGVLLQASNM